MGIYEDSNAVALRLQRLQEEPELGFSSSALHSNTGEELIQQFQSVGLKSDFNEDASVNEDLKDCGSPHASASLPLRPYAGDCSHYIRTGTCKFGIRCRFNHPFRSTSSVFKEKEWSSEKTGLIECKYYLTAGGCKYGASCRYSHSKDESEIAPPELNFLGLPIRLGEKECPYYMRKGSCGYGDHCVFHHPEPVSAREGLNPPKLSYESTLRSGYSLGSSDNEPASLLSPGALQPDQAPWASQALVNSSFPYRNDCPIYMTVNSFAQGMYRHSGWKYSQVSDFPAENRQTDSTPGLDRAFVLESDISIQVEQFPARPGQPVCAYFLKTGDCKFRSACQFHHPKDWAPKSCGCVLSDKGLPLRPGKNICQHYDRFGICKFGPACLYDHPINHIFSTFSKQSTSKPASETDIGY